MKNKLTLSNDRTYLKNIVYYWFPVILWGFIIFMLSSYPTKKTSQIHWQDFIVKKTAHIVEYFTFSLISYRAFRGSGIARIKSLKNAFLLSSLYGLSDEFHQSFTPGREPKIRDVFIDISGSLLGVIFIKYYILQARGKLKLLFTKIGLV